MERATVKGMKIGYALTGSWEEAVAKTKVTMQKNYEIIKLLCKADFDVNYESQRFGSLLLTFIKKNSYEIAKLLIEHGADVNYGYEHLDDMRYDTPLVTALQCKYFDIVQLLVDNGAKVNYTCPKYKDDYASIHIRYRFDPIKKIPLCVAITQGSPEGISILINADVDVNYTFEKEKFRISNKGNIIYEGRSSFSIMDIALEKGYYSSHSQDSLNVLQQIIQAGAIITPTQLFGLKDKDNILFEKMMIYGCFSTKKVRTALKQLNKLEKYEVTLNKIEKFNFTDNRKILTEFLNYIASDMESVVYKSPANILELISDYVVESDKLLNATLYVNYIKYHPVVGNDNKEVIGNIEEKYLE